MSLQNDLKYIKKQLELINRNYPQHLRSQVKFINQASKVSKQVPVEPNSLQYIREVISYNIKNSNVIFNYQDILNTLSKSKIYDNGTNDIIKKISIIYDKFLDDTNLSCLKSSVSYDHESTLMDFSTTNFDLNVLDLNDFEFDTNNFLEPVEDFYNSIPESILENNETNLIEESLIDLKLQSSDNKENKINTILTIISIFFTILSFITNDPELKKSLKFNFSKDKDFDK